MIDIIFLALVVAFLLARLYHVFGTRAEERQIKVVLKPLDKGDKKKLAEEIAQVINEVESRQAAAQAPEELSPQDQLLAEIPDFSKSRFMNGARKVFELVLQAFYSGHMENVKELVSKKVLDAFNQAIAFRQENQLTSEVDFICFEKSELKDVKKLKNSFKIVVEFVSEQVNILRNAEGQVVEGDENFIQKITDVWTFERSLNAKNKNWVLVSTKKTA